MLKKIILASAIAAATTGVAVANTAPYVGASVGIINNTANVKALGSNFTGGAYRGVPFNVFAGYGGVISQSFYLAGELFGTVGTANISDNTQLKTSYGYGASIIPGVMLSDHTLAYARAGVLRSRFTNNNANSTQTGGQFGLGMQTSLTQNVDLRGEYDFVAYQSKNYKLGTTTASIAPRSDTFTVGLVYKFE
jgi:opacity protein-like surface antigen